MSNHITKNAKQISLKMNKKKYSYYLRLKKEIEELKKENDFLKKAVAFFAKEI